MSQVPGQVEPVKNLFTSEELHILLKDYYLGKLQDDGLRSNIINILSSSVNPETLNNVEGLVYAQETQSIMQPQNIMQPVINNGPNNPESKAAISVGYIGISSIVLAPTI